MTFPLYIVNHDTGYSVNTDKCVVPFGSSIPYFGTNPIGYAFPGNKHRILIDMATSEVALGKVFNARDEGVKEIPSSWGVDKEGNHTSNPNDVVYLSPLGGYKGTALAVMVEGFTGLFTGVFGPHIVTMYKELDKYRNTSAFIFVMNKNIFGMGDKYSKNIDNMYEEIKSLDTAKGFEECFIAGEQSDRYYNYSLENGVAVYKHIYDFLKL